MSSFDHIIPPPPAGFHPVAEVEDKLAELHWPVDDPAWEWNLEMLSDEALLKRHHNSAAELAAQALTFDEEDRIVPREFSQKELDAANALQNYWRPVCEIKVRRAVRDVLQAIAHSKEFGCQNNQERKG